EDVSVVDDEMSIIDEIGDIRDAAGGFQEHRFMAKSDGRAAVFGVRERVRKTRRDVMGVDDEFPHARAAQIVEGPRDEGPMKKGDERLGKLVRERAQACAETRPQNEGLVHRASYVLIAALANRSAHRQEFFVT